MRLIILLLLSSCSSISHWTCYDDKEIKYSFIYEPLDQSKYKYCVSWSFEYE